MERKAGEYYGDLFQLDGHEDGHRIWQAVLKCGSNTLAVGVWYPGPRRIGTQPQVSSLARSSFCAL